MTAEHEEVIVEIDPIPDGEEVVDKGEEERTEEQLDEDQEVVAEVGEGTGAEEKEGVEGEEEDDAEKEEEEEEEVDPMAEVKQQIKVRWPSLLDRTNSTYSTSTYSTAQLYVHDFSATIAIVPICGIPSAQTSPAARAVRHQPVSRRW